MCCGWGCRTAVESLESRLLKGRLQKGRLQESRLQERRLQKGRLQESRLQERRLRRGSWLQMYLAADEAGCRGSSLQGKLVTEIWGVRVATVAMLVPPRGG